MDTGIGHTVEDALVRRVCRRVVRRGRQLLGRLAEVAAKLEVETNIVGDVEMCLAKDVSPLIRRLDVIDR